MSKTLKELHSIAIAQERQDGFKKFYFDETYYSLFCDELDMPTTLFESKYGYTEYGKLTAWHDVDPAVRERIESTMLKREL